MMPKIVVDDNVPEGTILFVPPIPIKHYFNLTTGEVKEYFNFDTKAAGMITNIK